MKTKAKTFLIKNSFILIILLMVLILHHPILDNISKSKLPFRMAPDTNLVLTILEWNMFAFLNDFNAIYHLNCLYPNAFITFYSHPLYGESIIFLLLNKLLGINITNSYTIYLLLGFWLGGIGTFLLARELTRNRLAPFLAALIFIIYPFFRFSFTHLHIFSIFWIGFIVYYLIRFLKNARIIDAVMAGFYIFIQGLFSIYHGFFFLAIFFPLFYLISVIYRNINFRNTIKLAIAILIFIILLAVVFSPFITTIKHSGLERKLDYGSLLTTSKIIRSCSQFYQTFKFSGATVLKLFPGFTVIFLVLMALSGTTKKWIFSSVFILLALVIVFFLNLNGHILASNWIFFCAMLTALVIFFLRARDMEPEIKTLMIILFLFPLIFFKFSTIIPGIQFSIYGLLTYIIPSLNNFRFLYRGVLLVVPVLAALAAVGMLGITQKAGKKRYLICGLVFLFVIFENGYLKTGSSSHFKFTPSKYHKIEKKR